MHTIYINEQELQTKRQLNILRVTQHQNHSGLDAAARSKSESFVHLPDLQENMTDKQRIKERKANRRRNTKARRVAIKGQQIEERRRRLRRERT